MENYNGFGYGIYVYSTDTYIQKNWYKIGSTNRIFDERVLEQDVTAVPEPLRLLMTFSVNGYNITPKELENKLHKYFDDRGKRLRLDKDREWFYDITIDDIKTAIKAILVDPDAFKMRLQLMPHQLDAYNFICDRFDNGSRNVLLNHKPRSGKTYICYQLLKDKKYKNVLLFTNYPVLNGQWQSGALNIYGLDYDIINVCSDTITEKIMFDERPNFVMVSFQDAKGKISDSDLPMLKEKFKILRGIKWDLIIVDECHRGKESELTDKLLGHLNYDRLLGLSATPTRNLLRGTFLPCDTHTYSISDEKKFKKLYPEIYTLPDISFYLYNPSKTIQSLMQYYKDEEFFNWNKFFQVEDGKLKYKNDIEIFFKWIAGFYGNNINMPLKKLNADSILMFVQNNECQPLLVDVLMNIDFYRNNYNIHYTNSEVNTNSADLLWKTKNEFITRDGKKSIVIANRQLTTGITLRKCDMVMFMNDWASMDEYIQASYRCQSPMKGKTNCSVIDFTPYRTFKIFKEFIEVNYISGNKSLEERYVEFFDSLSIFECNEDGKFSSIDLQGFKDKIVDIMDIKSRNFFGNYLIRKDEVDNDYLLLLEMMGKIGGEIDKGSINVRVNDNDIEKGKTKQTLREKRDRNIVESDKKLAFEDVVYILGKTPLLSICCDYKIDNLNDCLDYIHSDAEREKNFVEFLSLDGHLNINFATADFVYRNYINIELLNDRILTFNTKFRKLIYTENKNDRVINIEKVLELIESYVGVSKIEKKLLGEVQTPAKLVNEMLDTIPVEFWSNPYAKVLEPSNGSGVFVCVAIQRFMKGLESWQKDENLRYKHIIEKIIHVCELQPKNMFIYLQLFDPNNEYKEMKWHRGSFLDDGFDNKMKEWGIEKFDLILTNPPYNSEGGIGGGQGGESGLWKKFIYKSIKYFNINGYLLYVVPNTWAGNKTDFGRFKKYNLLFINMNDCSKYFKIDNTFSYFLLQNKEYQKETTIVTKLGKSKINISDLDLLPLSADVINNELFIILNKIFKNGVFEFHNGTNHSINTKFVSFEKNDEYKFPLFYSSEKSRRLVYSKEPFNGANLIKLISSYINDFDNDNVEHFTEVSIDKGVGKQSGYYKMENVQDCEKLRIFLKSNIVVFINNIYRNGRFANPVLNRIPKVDLNIVDNEDKIYKYFNLDIDEIKFIKVHTIKIKKQ